ncbi:MAG: PEP-CTERM sorting domain-containing protein, partial [Desulfobacteraceae bacterium]|nr:PEP-CTERM sorting domain-containing protein [Desulfobacteraceae bacterium]
SGLDHALFFETNKGYTISFEDIVGGGDADYEDLVVNFSPSDGTGFASTPEPGTNFLLGIGLIVMGIFIKRHRLKKPALSKI